jgi:CRP-like cAMP-binding protein
MDAARIKRIPIFGDLTEGELKVISTFATLEELPAGAVAVREGDFANRFMAIDEGEAKVIRDGVEIGRLGAGDIFGEVGLIEKERRAATVEAETPLRLIQIEHWELQRMKKMLPQVYARIEQLAAERSDLS